VCDVESWVLLSRRGVIWGGWEELGWVIERKKRQIGVLEFIWNEKKKKKKKKK